MAKKPDTPCAACGKLLWSGPRSRPADERLCVACRKAGGSAQRLGAHLVQIESGAGAAAERMVEAAAQMNGAVDGAMERAALSVDQARQGLQAQGQTMLAMIEQSRAAFEQAGAETTKGLAERLDLAGQKIEMLAGRLATQDQASRTLLGNIARSHQTFNNKLRHRRGCTLKGTSPGSISGPTDGQTGVSLTRTLVLLRGSLHLHLC